MFSERKESLAVKLVIHAVEQLFHSSLSFPLNTFLFTMECKCVKQKLCIASRRVEIF